MIPPAERTTLELRTLQGLRTLFGSARAHDAELRKTAGITGSQLWALSEIAQSPLPDGLTVNGLSAQMALHQTTASNLVNVLVERGLIRRERDTVDQRVVHLRVTAQGERLLLRTPGPHAGVLVDALRQLEPVQLSELCRSLGWVIKQMRRTTESAAGETLMGE
ncbi:MAG TPA: MarR family winged helix-turn-helix transcriptional regulator [Steroidobacteraceae bacterium]|nr:MarR family winged helix-turn-helix transcriptional regulator [Steroidobacteraceae bacterium]